MTPAKPIHLPKDDGVTHINIYSKGRTALGRELSNFAHTPFNHPKYGFFASVEAFWYYLGTGCKHQELRQLYGMSAKSVGRLLEQVPIENFEGEIEDAIVYKIEQHPRILKGILENKLPYTHYLVFGSHDYKIVDKTDDSQFMLRAIERVKQKYISPIG